MIVSWSVGNNRSIISLRQSDIPETIWHKLGRSDSSYLAFGVCFVRYHLQISFDVGCTRHARNIVSWLQIEVMHLLVFGSGCIALIDISFYRSCIRASTTMDFPSPPAKDNRAGFFTPKLKRIYELWCQTVLPWKKMDCSVLQRIPIPTSNPPAMIAGANGSCGGLGRFIICSAMNDWDAKGWRRRLRGDSQ